MDSNEDVGFPEAEKIVNAVILSAVEMNASDVHLEPVEIQAGGASKLRLRFRVDGVLAPAPFEIPWKAHSAVMAKLKIMASLDITERRVPQTGRIEVAVKGRPFELRLEIMPTVHGEACALRVLDGSKQGIGIMDLGLLPDTRDELLALFDRAGGAKKTGLVLVCGRACSGKTTALYALLNHVKKPDIKIVTIECPVERALEGLVQVPVNTAISVEGGRRFDHATALRHAMRFDPDIVMTDEMGDSQTSELVLEAARSCLVLTSIYVRGAGDALARLADMGLPAYKMSAALKAVLTLRLARRLCETCKTPREPDAEERELFEKNAVDLPAGSRIFGPPKGGGCTACRNLGFKGRAGVHELLFVDDEIRSALMKGADVEALRAASRQKGMRRLAQDGLEKVKLGLTTISEALGGSDD